MREVNICRAVMAALERPSPYLANIHHPSYMRELRTWRAGDEIVVRLEKRGFHSYKRRYPYPKKEPPKVDINGLQAYLNSVMVGYKFTEISDGGRFVDLIIEECNNNEDT